MNRRHLSSKNTTWKSAVLIVINIYGSRKSIVASFDVGFTKKHLNRCRPISPKTNVRVFVRRESFMVVLNLFVLMENT